MQAGTRILAAALVLAGAHGAGADEEAPAPPAPLSLEWCIARARAANPQLAADASDARAARERVVPAGSLEDPRFGYSASNVPTGELDFDSTPMSGHQLGLSQKIPFPGLLGSREEAARAAARAADAALADRERRVAAAVERAWAELGFAQRALGITERNLDLLRQLTRIAEKKYSVGTGLQEDVLRAQVQVTRVLDDELTHRAAIARGEASLAGILDLPTGLALPRTEPLQEDAALPSLEDVLGHLEETSPRLVSHRERVAEAERMRRATELEGYPDFDLGFGYRVRERVMGDPVPGDDFLSASVTIRLPINRSKWRARVAEREALWRKARSEYRQALATLRDDVRSAFAELERADSAVALLRFGLVPQARQSLEASRSAYEVDEVDFLSLIDSQVSLFEAELRLERARADRRVGFAALEAASGEVLR